MLDLLRDAFQSDEAGARGVNDLMQKGYVYYRTKPMGRAFAAAFKPELTPKQMLEFGVFGGKYMTDCTKEFPASWFKKANLCRERHESSLNFFRVNASQPLSVWREKGWIYHEDPRGWFQWYCRGTMLAGAARMTNGRSDDGALSADMSRRLKRIAGPATGRAAHGNGRLCSIGHTIRVRSDSTSHTAGRYRH